MPPQASGFCGEEAAFQAPPGREGFSLVKELVFIARKPRRVVPWEEIPPLYSGRDFLIKAGVN